MANLTTQQIGIGGTQPVYGAASAGGDRFSPDSRCFLHVKGATAVTITGYGSGPGGNPVANRVVNVATEDMIGPFDPSGFGAPDGLGGLVTCNPTAGVTLACLRL